MEIRSKKIKARFVCALSIYFLDKKPVCVLGKVDGYLSDKPRGKNGFGYDPIFFLPEFNKTSAQLTDDEKNKISHRALALAGIEEYFSNIGK